MNNHERKEVLQIIIDLYLPEDEEIIFSRIPIQQEDVDGKKFLAYTFFLQRLSYFPEELTGDESVDRKLREKLMNDAKMFNYPTRKIEYAEPFSRGYGE